MLQVLCKKLIAWCWEFELYACFMPYNLAFKLHHVFNWKRLGHILLISDSFDGEAGLNIVV